MENLDLMTLRNLILFNELGSLALTADHAGRTQAAISLQMRKLEAQIGHKLFEKKGRRIQLTSTGLNLLKYAQHMIQLNDEALSNVRVQLAGKVTLGLTQDLAEDWLLPILNDFKLKYPGVHVNVHVDRNYILEKIFQKNGLDLAILAKEKNKQQEAPHIAAQMVWVSKNKILENKTPVQLVLFDSPCIFRDTAINNLKSAKIPFDISFTSSSLSAVWSAVRAGLGVTVRSSLSTPADLTLSNRIFKNAQKLSSINFCLMSSKKIQNQAVKSLHDNLEVALIRSRQ